jgi:hypothetical protein
MPAVSFSFSLTGENIAPLDARCYVFSFPWGEKDSNPIFQK